MRAATLVLRRARAQIGTLATLAVLIATVAVILAGAVGYTRAASVATVRDTLDNAAPVDAGIQVRTRLADDPEEQDAALRSGLAGMGVALDVTRTLRTEVASAERAGNSAVAGNPAVGEGEDGEEGGGDAGGGGDGDAVRVVLGELPADDDAIVVTGKLPGPDEVLVPEQSAVEADLETGDRLVLRGAALTVAGTWAPADPDDRLWFADPMVAAGLDGTTYGPLLAGAGTIADVDPAPFALWTAYPRTADLTVADLPGLTVALTQLDYVLGNDDALAVRGLTVEGSLAQTVADLELATSTAAAVGLVPVALLAVISLIALVQVVRLLGQTRAREIEILVARGASARQITVWSALELAVVTATATTLGTGLAVLMVGRLDGGAAQREITVALGVTIGVVALATGTLVAGLQARSIVRRMAADRSGRLQDAATVSTVVLAVAAAGLSTWQLLRHATPLVVADDGTTQADLLAVVSLGAVLGALAMLALSFLGPAARVVANLRARSRGLVGVLAARQISRRVRAYAVPLVLIVLAAASGTVAASFAGATFTQRDHVGALSTGTDVRVTVPVGATSRLAVPQSVSAQPYAEITDVGGAGTVLRGGATFGERPMVLTALDTTRVEEFVRVPEQIDLGAAVDGLRTWDAPGVAVPAGTQELELTVRASAAVIDEVVANRDELLETEVDWLTAQGVPEDEARQMVAEAAAGFLSEELEVRTTLWLVDDDGAPSMLDGAVLTARLDGQVADVGPEPTEHTLTLTMPGPAGYRIVAVDLDYDRPTLESELSYEISSLAADGADLPLEGTAWAAGQEPGADEGVAAKLASTGVIGVSGVLPPVGSPESLFLRLMPEAAPATVPAVVTDALAGAADLADGSVATVNHRGVRVEATVAGTVTAVPGGLEEDVALVDLQTLTGYLLGQQGAVLLPGEVWLATDDGAGQADDSALDSVAAAAGALGGPQAGIEIAGQEITDSAASVRETFWIAAGGAVLLAITGVAAVALALTRERRSEVMVLRALGLPPRGQAGSRSAELLGVGVLGAIFGVLAGWAAAALLVPTLARAAATQNTPLPLGAGRLDLLPALGLLVALGAGLAVVAVTVAGRVRAQALDAEYREEVR